MNKILFRVCEAMDGRKFALLTDQPEVEDKFDNGYKVAYKSQDGSNSPELLVHWKNEYTVMTEEFSLVPVPGEIPMELQAAFNSMLSGLIKGIDVLFCDYNLGVVSDLPMCDQIMNSHKSTDFVLFSCGDIVGTDPSVQPYMVSYAEPRYETGAQVSQQHRIYCKTEAFAFSQSVNAIVAQRNKGNLIGGHIRSDLDPYIGEPTIDESAAKNIISRYVEALINRNNKS